MPGPVPVPVPVLRLPRGPDGSGRGFSPGSARHRALLAAAEDAAAQQGARAALRCRYLRGLAAARGRPARFDLRGGAGGVEAVFGAADVAGAAGIQVDALRTPLGVQAAALLRCCDLLAFSFLLG